MMSMPYPNYHEQTRYTLDSNTSHTMRAIRDNIHTISNNLMNQLVRVETIDGDVFEGTVVQTDRGILYLKLADHGTSRAFFPNPFSSFILPLVLYELLVITLLV